MEDDKHRDIHSKVVRFQLPKIPTSAGDPFCGELRRVRAVIEPDRLSSSVRRLTVISTLMSNQQLKFNLIENSTISLWSCDSLEEI
jgi:hypothetical protein